MFFSENNILFFEICNVEFDDFENITKNEETITFIISLLLEKQQSCFQFLYVYNILNNFTF